MGTEHLAQWGHTEGTLAASGKVTAVTVCAGGGVYQGTRRETSITPVPPECQPAECLDTYNALCQVSERQLSTDSTFNLRLEGQTA